MKAHVAWSFTTSCQLVSLDRFLLMNEVHPPQGGVHLVVSSSLLAYTSRVASGGGHRTFSSHDQTTASVSSSAVLLAVLQSPSRCRHSSLCPRMSRRHLMWKVLSFLMSCCVTGHASAPCRGIGITNVRRTRSLVVLLRLRLRNTFHLHIWYTVPAFFSVTITSLSTLLVWPTSTGFHFLQLLVFEFQWWLVVCHTHCEDLCPLPIDVHAPSLTCLVQGGNHML